MRVMFSLSLLSLGMLIGLSLSAQPPQEAQKKGPPAPKNLKVLKPEEIRPVMGGMRASLGVAQCTFCHVMGDNASDENPKKLVARAMMKMVKDINASTPELKAQVTCYTCHRGKTAPENAPAPPAPAQ